MLLKKEKCDLVTGILHSPEYHQTLQQEEKIYNKKELSRILSPFPLLQKCHNSASKEKKYVNKESIITQ